MYTEVGGNQVQKLAQYVLKVIKINVSTCM